MQPASNARAGGGIFRDDVRHSLEKSARRKVRSFVEEAEYLIVVRRYGRPEIMTRRASAMLHNCKRPFLNALTQKDPELHPARSIRKAQN